MLRLGLIICFVQTFSLIGRSAGHGYLADPPARSSAWLFDPDFTSCCRYYNHAQMSCGGTYQQWAVNGGKCSICGEAYDLNPQVLGIGGAMYLGKIVRTYTEGATIPVTVVLTANHLGVFEFRVCSVDSDPTKDATQECLNANVLTVSNEFTAPNGTNEPLQYRVSKTAATVKLQVTLPATLTCKHCVFQWKYRTGNSWGVSNGKACVGCGAENEEFYGCSDIAITSATETTVNPATPAVTQASSVTTSQPITAVTPPRKCTSTVIFSQSFDISAIVDQYCQVVCPGNCASDNVVGNEILYKACVSTCNKLCACG